MARVVLFCLLFSSLFSDIVVIPNEEPGIENPWFTGPLLTPNSIVVPAGHFNFQPYVFSIANTGFYDKHGKGVKRPTLWVNSLQPILQVGLTKWMDFQIAPSVNYSISQHKGAWSFSDFPLIFDFQLFSPRPQGDFRPFIKLALIEIFPTGKYQKLDPNKNGADIGGLGSYQTILGIAVGKLIHIQGIHFISSRFYAQYTLPSPVRVKGFNAYGGGFGAKARIFPSQNFEVDIGLEYNLTKNWALASDFVGIWFSKTHYSGTSGFTRDGNKAELGTKAGCQYALAPAIEYNFSENLGVIFGSWFTVAGRNAPRFWSIVPSLNWYY